MYERHMNAEDVRRQLFHVLRRVRQAGETVVVEEEGAPGVVIVPVRRYEELVERENDSRAAG